MKGGIIVKKKEMRAMKKRNGGHVKENTDCKNLIDELLSCKRNE